MNIAVGAEKDAVLEQALAEPKIAEAVAGKQLVRGTIVIPNGCDKEKAFEIAKADERIASFLEGKNLIKEIYVPNKIVNFVAK